MTSPLQVTPTVKPKSTMRLTSEQMTIFLLAMEKRLARRLTQDELKSPVFRAASRVYADAMVKKGK